jgi:two-component system KDP operon response regulator KdpE
MVVADSDPAIGRLLSRDLPIEGFSVGLVRSGEEVLAQIGVDRPDVVVIGDDLPDMSAMTLISKLHHDVDLRSLLLMTDFNADSATAALDAGADDCMAKPFLVGELAARLRKIVRRALTQHGVPAMIQTDLLEIDCVRWQVRLRGRIVPLSWKEYALLRMLIEKSGHVVRTSDMLLKIWGIRRPVGSDHVRLTVQRLRRKLELAQSAGVHIVAEPKIGYRLCLPSGSVGGNPRRYS